MSKALHYYGCTVLAAKGKKGIITPDDNGYREVCLGAIDASTEDGTIYTFTDRVRDVFEGNGSTFRRQISRGLLKGEYGHPKFERGMNLVTYMMRLRKVEPTLVSHHIKAVRLEEGRDHKGKRCILVYGLVKGTGPHMAAMEEHLKNPDENVAYSVRSFTDTKTISGVDYKEITDLVTWDYVIEPGYYIATKFDSVGCESFTDQFILEPEKEFHVSDIIAAEAQTRSLVSAGMESAELDFTYLRTSIGAYEKVQVMNRMASLDI